MTTHELARYLLEYTADVPVFINGWGSAEGSDCEVTGAGLQDNGVFLGHGDIDFRTSEWSDWYMTTDRIGPNSIK
jgi:hypothetical protein